jgi:hypothetical protein
MVQELLEQTETIAFTESPANSTQQPTDPFALESASQTELSKALAIAQGLFPPMKQSGYNNHLKYAYSILSDMVEAIREALAANGLSVVHQTCPIEGRTWLRTKLKHESGEWIATYCELAAELTVQKGNSIHQARGTERTYAKKSNLADLLNLSPDQDTDGAHSDAEKKPPAKGRQKQPPSTGKESIGDLKNSITKAEKGVAKADDKFVKDDFRKEHMGAVSLPNDAAKLRAYLAALSEYDYGSGAEEPAAEEEADLTAMKEQAKWIEDSIKDMDEGFDPVAFRTEHTGLAKLSDNAEELEAYIGLLNARDTELKGQLPHG